MRRPLLVVSLCSLFVAGLGFVHSLAEGAPTATSTTTPWDAVKGALVPTSD